MMNNFGNRIRDLRKKRKLTMKELGERIGVATTTISGYEYGTRKPDVETLVKLAAIFELSVDELIGCQKPNDLELEDLIKLIEAGSVKHEGKELSDLTKHRLIVMLDMFRESN